MGCIIIIVHGLNSLGKEKEAVPHYETAIQLGLGHEDLEGAYLGL